jgi:hypothetical protein
MRQDRTGRAKRPENRHRRHLHRQCDQRL